MDNLAALTELDRENLIYEIATRARTAKQLASAYETTVDALKSFVEEYENDITVAREQASQAGEEGEPTPVELSHLWIANKTERIQKMQNIADRLYVDCMNTFDAATLREFRSYCAAVANELGQLLHRGAGESGSDSLSVDIQGISLDNLK